MGRPVYHPLNEALLLLLSRFSHVQLFATPWTAAYQAPLPMGFSRQEYWSRVPFEAHPSTKGFILFSTGRFETFLLSQEEIKVAYHRSFLCNIFYDSQFKDVSYKKI